MSKVTEAFRAHHRELADEMTNYVTAFLQAVPTADAIGFAGFLKNELVPHAVGEEQQLYPVVDDLLRTHGKPTATMSIDHEYIQNYIRQIDEAALALADAGPDAQSGLRNKIAQLGLELKAIFDLHLAKEERIYLPLLEQYVSDDAQERLLQAMHEPAGGSKAETLDVRSISPANRHTLIFQTFDALPSGTAFELVNDHDPKPLYYQFAAELAGKFTWDYMERGPQVWRVRIGKANGGH